MSRRDLPMGPGEARRPRHELYQNRSADEQHAHDMKQREAFKADAAKREERLREAMLEAGHELSDVRVQGGSRAVVGFCSRCNKDGWAKTDGSLSGDALTQACRPARARDPELEWWSAYNRGVSLPALSPELARAMLERLPLQVAKGSISAPAAGLARQAIERSRS